MLELENVSVSYGSIRALRGVTLEVREGELVTLIGSNGAGKSTCLLAISGVLHPQQGRILYQGKDITRLSPFEVVRRGISQSPEGRHIFARLSVSENLMLGAVQRRDAEIGRASCRERV
jgi:branched-chain amino acid transport system ATP-binding protein